MEKDLTTGTAFSTQHAINKLTAAVILASVRNSMAGKFTDHLKPVIEFIQNLPAYSGNMLELHCSRDDAWFDFALRVNSEYDKPLLSNELVLYNASPFIKYGYQQLLNESKTGFRYGIENICFEYDFPFQNAPSVFFDIGRDVDFSPEQIFSSLGNIMGSFQYPIYSGLLNLLLTIKENNLHVVFFGSMFSRKSRSIRLTINGIEPGRLIETLKTLGWNGNYKLIADLGFDYLHSAQKIVLAIDFDNQLRNRIGIEIFDNDSGIFIDKLCRNNILSKEHLELLTKWPGTTDIGSRLSIALSHQQRRTIHCIYRRINHFKFIVDGDRITTKAYLYYCF